MDIYDETVLKLESEKQLKNCEDMHIWVKPIKDYIKELEAKEERAKKVEELLGLYRKRDSNIDHLTCSQIAKLDDEIDELEEELK